jgi:hypothetical protein
MRDLGVSKSMKNDSAVEILIRWMGDHLVKPHSRKIIDA